MEDTSIEAFRELQRTGKLNIRYMQVIEAVKESPGCTQSEACRNIFLKLGRDSSITNRSFTPRFSPLVRAGVFEEKAKRRCHCTGRRVKTYEFTGKMPDLKKLKHCMKGLRAEHYALLKKFAKYAEVFEDQPPKAGQMSLGFDSVDPHACQQIVATYIASPRTRQDWINLVRAGYKLLQPD